MFWGMLVIYSVVFAVLAAVVCGKGKSSYYIGAKILNSLAFLAVFVFTVAQSGKGAALLQMLPAFLCCFAGDIFMALYNGSRRKRYFLIGLFVFLIGHLCFVRWLCGMQTLTGGDVLAALCAVAGAYGLCLLPGMKTGRLKPFILLYAFFVALFFFKGLRLALAFPLPSNCFAAVGSALFFVSDISILFLYFWKKKSTAVHLFNLATYYYGMFFLASCLLFD